MRRDGKMQSVLVLEFPGRPSLARATSPTTWGSFWQGTAGNYIGPPGTAENIGGRRGTIEDDGGRWGTVGDDIMSSVLVLGSYLSGKFRKRRDGTTKCRPPWPRTDGLPRCEHCDVGAPLPAIPNTILYYWIMPSSSTSFRQGRL